jgi:S1-C subfamily serine protease
MHSSRFMKLSGIILAIALIVLAGVQTGNVNAGPAAQGTATVEATTAAGDTAATTVATADTAAATTEAVEATTASTAASTMKFPPCPPATAEAGATIAATTAVATTEATATTAATTDAAATAAVAHTPGYLGVRAEQVAECGVRIVEVVVDGPAATAGIQEGDVIVALDGTAQNSITQLRLALEAASPGEEVTLTIQRNGAEQDVKVTLGTRPAEAGAATTTEAATAAATEVATEAATEAATAAQ